MSLETKKISELEQLEELSGEENVLMEADGTTKRFPAAKLGTVKTVNGAATDEAGNVEIEIPEGFSGSWNDLTDKPEGVGYTEKVNIPETELTAIDDGFVLPGFVPVAGGTYEITWNGTVYICAAAEIENNEEPGVALGNVGLIDGTGDTGEPFVMAYAETQNEQFGYVATLVMPTTDIGDTVPTVAITGGVVHKIQDEYVNMPQKLTELENDLFYPAREELLTFSEADVITDAEGNTVHTHAQLDLSWVEVDTEGKATNLGYALTLLIGTSEVTYTEELLPIYLTRETLDSGEVVESGVAYVSDEPSDSMFFTFENRTDGLVFYVKDTLGSATFTIVLDRVNGEGGIIPADCLDLGAVIKIAENAVATAEKYKPLIVTVTDDGSGNLTADTAPVIIRQKALVPAPIYLTYNGRRAHFDYPQGASVAVAHFSEFYTNDAGQPCYCKYVVKNSGVTRTEYVLSTSTT